MKYNPLPLVTFIASSFGTHWVKGFVVLVFSSVAVQGSAQSIPRGTVMHRALAPGVCPSGAIDFTQLPLESYSNQDIAGGVSVYSDGAEILLSGNRWHQATDVFATFSDVDSLPGFNALQITVGSVAELSGSKMLTP